MRARAFCFRTGIEGIASKQGVQVRGFRSVPSGSILLAEESEGSEVTVADEEAGVVSGKKKYGPRRSQRLPRSIIGSYGDDFEDELDLAEPSPWQGIMYDIRPKVDQFMIDEMGANPPLDLEDLVDEAEELGMISEIPDEYAGLPLVLRWETRFVLAPGPTAHHPLNRKVKLQAYLQDLGLSGNARERMIALVGPRFNRGKDELTLVSQRYPQREENRKDVLRILYALIDESKKADLEGEQMAAAA